MLLTLNGITRVLDDPLEVARYKRFGYVEVKAGNKTPAPSGSLRPDFATNVVEEKSKAKPTKKAGAK